MKFGLLLKSDSNNLFPTTRVVTDISSNIGFVSITIEPPVKISSNQILLLDKVKRK